MQPHFIRKHYTTGKDSEYILIGLLIEILIGADILG